MGTAGASAALLLAGCEDDKKKPSATATATTFAPPPSDASDRNGTLRVYNYDALIADSLDPHRTRSGAIANLHSAIFSRLYRYADAINGTIVPDLASGMPEQPDELTYVIKLRPGASFHNSVFAQQAEPSIAGRAVVADDVVDSIERQAAAARAPAGTFPRSSQFAAIDHIGRTGTDLVTIRLKQPVAPFTSFLAGVHAFVLPSEIAGKSEANDLKALIGSGPFMFDYFEAGVSARLLRNPMWFARDDDTAASAKGRPFIDAYVAFLSPDSDDFQRAAFDRKLVDATPLTDPESVRRALATNLEDATLEQTLSGRVLASRLLIDRDPLKDVRVRRAIHLAMDRRQLGDLLYPQYNDERSWRLSGPIPPAFERWALAADDLERRPAYRAQRLSDLTDAKQSWEAALGQAPIADIPVLFAGVPKAIVDKAAPQVQRMLREGLGVNVVIQSDPSGDAVVSAALRRNSEGASEGTALFTFRLEDGGIDLDDCVYLQYHSGESDNSYRLQDAALDSLLEKQRGEFDDDKRRELGTSIQEYLLANVNARLDYVSPIERRLVWGYARNVKAAPVFGFGERLADAWLDHSHDAWQGRPT